MFSVCFAARRKFVLAISLSQRNNLCSCFLELKQFRRGFSLFWKNGEKWKQYSTFVWQWDENSLYTISFSRKTHFYTCFCEPKKFRRGFSLLRKKGDRWKERSFCSQPNIRFTAIVFLEKLTFGHVFIDWNNSEKDFRF